MQPLEVVGNLAVQLAKNIGTKSCGNNKLIEKLVEVFFGS